MALPSRDQTFAYENCRDLVQKLDREIDRYREVAGSDLHEPGDALLKLVDQLKDNAFNASVTAWQLCDWVFNDLPIEQRRKLGFKELVDLQNHVTRQCRALHLCRQAATASKHWSVEKYADPTVKTIVTAETGWTIYFVDGDKPTIFEHSTPWILAHMGMRERARNHLGISAGFGLIVACAL